MFEDFSKRSKAVRAALDFARDKAWGEIGLSDIAAAANLGLADLRREFGCKSDILNVTNPDILNVADYNSPSGATPLRNGVVQDFAVAYSGTQDGFIVSTGNMADDYRSKLGQLGLAGGEVTKAVDKQTKGMGANAFAMDKAKAAAEAQRKELGDKLATAYVNLEIIGGQVAKSFGDEPHGPPASPFTDGADFDGFLAELLGDLLLRFGVVLGYKRRLGGNVEPLPVILGRQVVADRKVFLQRGKSFQIGRAHV